MRQALRPRLVATLCVVAASSALAVGCGSNPTSASTTPTVQTFTGTLAPGGVSGITFTSNSDGAVDITLVSVQPQSTIALGVSIGALLADGTCASLGQTSNFIVGGPPFSGSLSAGVYCVAIYDLGTVVGTDTYTVTISHF